MSYYTDLSTVRMISDLFFSQICWSDAAALTATGEVNEHVNVSCALTYFVTSIDRVSMFLENDDIREEVNAVLKRPWSETSEVCSPSSSAERNEHRIKLIGEAHDQLREIIKKYELADILLDQS